MAPEIADSDEELDIEVEVPNATTPAPALTRLVDAGNYDPTQALSDLNSSTNKGTSSTDQLLNELQEAASDGAHDVDRLLLNPTEMAGAVVNAGENRRSQSDVLETHVEHETSRKKRVKTYGSKTRDLSASVFADLARNDEQNPLSTPQEPAYSHQEAATPTSTEPLMQERGLYTRERDRPRRVISLLTQANIGNPVTTTMSSVGSYQSINLDFRDGSNGIDVNVNPFGSISQVTNDVDEPLENALPSQSNTDQLNDLIDEFAGPDIQSQMQTSPVRQGTPTAPSVEPLSESEQLALPDQVQSIAPEDGERPAKRRKTDLAMPRETDSPASSRAPRASSMSPGIEIATTTRPSAKKRGRKPKVSKLGLDADELGADDPAHVIMGPPPTGDSWEHRQRREASLEVSSQASQVSQAASNTKRKRKMTKTDELNKQPSSELNLSDEQFIGLPKENYQPRPSRSRSKRTDHAPLPPTESGTPLKVAGVDQGSPLPLSTTAKGRKSKVKRAKTAAGALLKKADSMLSDGEEDVLWVDTKPAPVKLDMPPDLRALKKESAPELEASEDELHEPGPKKKAGVLVEIPILEGDGLGQKDDSTGKKAPKKRGRKPKKSATAVDQDPVEPAPAAGWQDDCGPLATKDVNTPAKPSARSKATITDSDDEEKQAPPDPGPMYTDKENILPTDVKRMTPSPPKPSARPTHSPLKTTPLSSSSASTNRYRVGLSRKSKIPSLLRKVQRDKPPPTKTAIKSKELKVKGFNDGGDMEGGEDGEGKPWNGVLRDKDGRLVEWDF
jgi:hypothetical protein